MVTNAGQRMMKQMLIAILSLSMVAFSAQKIDRLERGFRLPPDSARPWVYWVWMDGNLSREGISADLEAMKRAGIGGVIIMEVNVGIPQGPVKFMSQEWREHFKHVISEAERLGIEVALISGPGWTGSGGPWVKPEQSMQHIVSSTTQVSGPTHFVGALPRPARRPAFFGDGHLPPEREKAKNDFYEDVAVLAFPTPKEKEVIRDIDEKALYVRAPYSSQPNVRPFIPSPADYPPPHAGAVISTSQIVDLSQSLTPDGRITWDVPSGDWTILRFGRTSTGANTRPAPVPGLGIECDKLDTAALNAHFDAFIGTLLRDIGSRKKKTGAGLTMLHIDSWEMGAQNWTPAFREEFCRRRGYDLLKYLPAVTGSIVESPEISERFLWDLRQTVNELILQNHAEHLKQLGRRHSLRLSIEPYDMTPCADMSLGAIADVPMCEFWLYGFNTSYSVIEGTSIAHTGGRAVVAAEAFTSTDAEHWQAYPGSMKALGDWAFCAGVNRFVFHRYQHQPWPDLRPGMTMGPYGVHWERTQTWWEMASAYHTYLTRCQFMLRQGLPVADVCFLVAEGAPHVFRPPASAMRGDPPDRLGYNFDGCAPEVLLARASVKEGRLVFPDGMKYRLLVLPNRETMTPRLLRRVKQLVEAGATVVGPRPRKSPGLSDFPDCDAEVKKLADEVWGECDGNRVTERRFGKGRVMWEKRPGADSARNGTGGMEPEQYGSFTLATDILNRMGVPPDLESEATVRYTHRTEHGVEIYFVANPENRSLTTRCTFRVSGKQPELWDPVRAETRYIPQFALKSGRTSMELRFEPHQSFFVVFRKISQERTGESRNFADVEPVAELSGGWEVSFDPKWGGPDTISFSRLEDWSRQPEDGIKYYSGVAAYRCTFGVPSTLLTPSPDRSRSRIWLDLGEVRNIGSVRVNGHNLGILWCAPWRVDISGFVKPEGNQLEIRVANLWPNRLIGDELLPPDSDFGRRGNLVRWPAWILGKEPRPRTGRHAFSTWKHFAGDSPLLPSGLLGPVRLLRSWE
jgi:hypothetical protein